ncbi:MAG: alpha/beta fold hydrolase [Alphaproteobacteria bacterium]|nr:alpha/beta fold hydrolase [Alphaproteobacteria bacterium]
MKNRFCKTIFKLILLFVTVYAVLCFAIYLFPELFVNHPSDKVSDIEKAREKGYPAELMSYKAKDGTKLYGWYTKGTNGKAILFAHGNAMNLERFYHKLIPLANAGYATFLPEYRGYGGIKGKINSHNLTLDTIAGLEELYKLGYKNEDIIIYGMSLGSHMATATAYYMKKNGKFDALVLEVPFDNLPNTAKNVIPFYMPFDFLMKDKYDSLSLISEVDTRVLIMAAEKDVIVPNQRAKALYQAAAEPKNFILYENGKHSYLYAKANYKDMLKWLSLR